MIAILDYGIGNVASIHNMLKKIGAVSVVTNDIDIISKAEKLILPGVGSFDACASKFYSSGLMEILNQKVIIEKKQLLGICVGMQLLMEGSEEGKLPGLGWVKGECKRFYNLKQHNLKIPHMGWTDVLASKRSKLLGNMTEQSRFYFVHSYHTVLHNLEDELLSAFYSYKFTAAFEHDNIFGVQFHPEKSHKYGMRLFEEFATM